MIANRIEVSLAQRFAAAWRWEAARVRSARAVIWLASIGVVAHTIAALGVAGFLAFDGASNVAYANADVARMVMVVPQVLPLVAALCAVLLVAADYRHAGAWALTCLLFPERWIAGAAKVAIAATIGFALALLGVLTSGAAIVFVYNPQGTAVAMSTLVPVAIGQIGTTVALALIGAFVTLAVRSSVAGVVTILVMAWVVEPAVRAVTVVAGHGWWSPLQNLLPFGAAGGLTRTTEASDAFPANPLGPWWSLVVVTGWVLVLAAVAYRATINTGSERRTLQVIPEEQVPAHA